MRFILDDGILPMWHQLRLENHLCTEVCSLAVVEVLWLPCKQAWASLKEAARPHGRTSMPLHQPASRQTPRWGHLGPSRLQLIGEPQEDEAWWSKSEDHPIFHTEWKIGDSFQLLTLKWFVLHHELKDTEVNIQQNCKIPGGGLFKQRVPEESTFWRVRRGEVLNEVKVGSVMRMKREEKNRSWG